MVPVRRSKESPPSRPVCLVPPMCESTLPFPAMISVVTVLGPIHQESHRQAKENRLRISPSLPCGNRPPWRMVVQVASLWEVEVHVKALPCHLRSHSWRVPVRNFCFTEDAKTALLCPGYMNVKNLIQDSRIGKFHHQPP